MTHKEARYGNNTMRFPYFSSRSNGGASMKEKQTAFEDSFIGFSDAIEKIIVYIVYALIIGLIVSQALLHSSAVRSRITKVDTLEGVHYENISKR
jgi:hypothetical protein